MFSFLRDFIILSLSPNLHLRQTVIAHVNKTSLSGQGTDKFVKLCREDPYTLVCTGLKLVGGSQRCWQEMSHFLNTIPQYSKWLNLYLEHFPKGSISQLSDYVPYLLRVFIPANVLVLFLLLLSSQFKYFTEIKK